MGYDAEAEYKGRTDPMTLLAYCFIGIETHQTVSMKDFWTRLKVTTPRARRTTMKTKL